MHFSLLNLQSNQCRFLSLYLPFRLSLQNHLIVLKPIDKFTIPGGNAVVSMCHVCRTVCRRAERAALRADARYGVDSTALVWLNRLSDYFYLLGRTLTAHYAVDEVLWIP